MNFILFGFGFTLGSLITLGIVAWYGLKQQKQLAEKNQTEQEEISKAIMEAFGVAPESKPASIHILKPQDDDDEPTKH